ncbi:hypothetical protein ABMA28_008917 [Loxostege sticticalis]|uniref:Uncharacterized protein n=1 Tax=Loxostege sticticalis TaxID=481309 RepID=A0ABD0SFM0_LOXSC
MNRVPFYLLEAEFRKLPKLFHLDDYERCLERKDGIYCLGMFDVYSDVTPNPVYDIIQEKSQDLSLYNRSYLHRGYCLPTRCPSSEANETARFERCVDAWARGHALRTRLHTLHYCRAHGQPRPLGPDTNDLPHRVVLYFACTMLVMALVGTVYDCFIAKKGSKNPYLTSFSIRINWKQLTSNYQDVDPRLRDLESFQTLRMYPLYLLLNGFAATWWKSIGDGPLWPVLVGAESENCRKKFWITAAFLQNFIQKRDLCLVQTWIMAVDLQLHMLILFLTLLLHKHRQHAVKVLSVLFVVATGLLAYKAFTEDLIPTYLYTNPEAYRNFFAAGGADSFFDLYIHPINGAMSAIAGSMIAFIHMDHQERNIKMSRSKVLVFLHHIATPFGVIWLYLAYPYFRHYDRWTQNLMVVIERLVGAISTSFFIYSIVNHKGLFHQIARSLRTVTRLSFSVSMCHWCIMILLYTDRWILQDSSYLRVFSDVIVVHVLSHIAAVPLTLLVEYPLQKFMERLINITGHRWFSPLKAKAQ